MSDFYESSDGRDAQSRHFNEDLGYIGVRLSSQQLETVIKRSSEAQDKAFRMICVEMHYPLNREDQRLAEEERKLLIEETEL